MAVGASAKPVLLPPERERDLWDAVSNDNLQLIVLPTEACNFRCSYCYESFALGRMRPDTVQALKRFFTRRIPTLKLLQLSWFGGEPLLALDVIEDLSAHILKLFHGRQDAAYYSDMTTNAFLLSPDVFERLFDLGVRQYQVSFDGRQPDHDQRRRLADGKPTFQRIWENLKGIQGSKKEFRITARLHLDSENLGGIQDFLDGFCAQFGGDPRFSLFIRPVSKLGGKQDHQLPTLELSKGIEIAKGHCRYSEAKGVASHTMEQGQTAPICYATRLNAWVIRSDGRLNKCTVAFERSVNDVGRIMPDGSVALERDKIARWIRPLDTRVLRDLTCPLQTLSHETSTAAPGRPCQCAEL